MKDKFWYYVKGRENFINILLLLIAIEYGAYCLYKGPIFSPDSFTYSAWADLIINNHFDVIAFSNQANFIFSASLYIIWICLVALFKLLFGDFWGHGIVALNLVSALMLIWLSLRFVARHTEGLLSVAFVAFCFATSLDFLNLVAYVLSDVSYAALVAFFLYWLSQRKIAGISLPKLLLAIMFLLLLMFYRPVTPPFFVVLFVAVISTPWFLNNDCCHRTKIVTMLIFLAVLSGIILFFHAALMMHSNATSTGVGWMSQLSREYHQGIVVYQRPETYLPMPIGYSDYLVISLLKMVYFWTVWFQGYGIIHRLINFLNLIPVYFLVGYSTVSVFSNSDRFKSSSTWASWILLLILGAFTFFHGLQQIDYDLRYRIPLYWPLYTLAGLGLYQIRCRHN